MALSPSELNKLLKVCKKLPDGPDYREDNYMRNLMLTALDFQLDAQKVVMPAIGHFEDKCGFQRTKKLKDLFAKYANTPGGNSKLAVDMWGFNLWTRAQFLRVIIERLESAGVRGQSSLKRWLETADFETDVKGRFKSTHHSIGYTLYEWLRLRCGFDTIKPDLHILAFIQEAVGRRVAPTEAVHALMEICSSSGRKAYRLDSAIWHHQHD
jgi:hypothetical protein